MPFKKLHSNIKEMLTSLEIVTPTPFQSASIPVIKSGANIFCTAPKGSGKTTTLVLTTLQKLKCEAVGNAPRAIVLVEKTERVLELEEVFSSLTKYNSLRVYSGNEREHIDVLKSEIFEGVDILICTPKTLHKLLLLEGLNTTQLKIFSIDDADFLAEKTSYAALMSIVPSIQKSQFVIYSEKISPTLKRFETSFMEYSKKVIM